MTREQMQTLVDAARATAKARKKLARAEADRRFLARVRAASDDALDVLARNHEHESTPYWKQIVIDRELTRRGRVWP